VCGMMNESMTSKSLRNGRNHNWNNMEAKRRGTVTGRRGD
jgi:hypothetical protein